MTTDSDLLIDKLAPDARDTIRAEVQDVMRSVLQEMGLFRAPKTEGGEGKGSDDPRVDWLQALDLDLGGMRATYQQAIEERIQAETSAWQQEAQRHTRDAILRVQRKQRITAFAAAATSGTDEAHVLPLLKDELEMFLQTLDDGQLKTAFKLFGQIQKQGVITLQEVGEEGQNQQLKELPAVYANALRRGDIRLTDLTNPVIAAAIGPVDQYDLSAFPANGAAA